MPDTVEPFRAAFLFVAGFAQRRKRANGVYTAFQRTYRRHAANDVLVQYVPWLAKPAEIAESLADVDAARREVFGDRCRLRLAIAGYSFGGFTAAEICRELLGRGVVVDDLTLCDPVGRWYGRWGWSRAVFPGTIRVPANVRLVTWIRQRNPRLRWTWPPLFPSSHDVACDAAETAVVGPWTLTDEHEAIDDSPAFQAVIDAAAAGLCPPAKREAA